MLEKYPVFRLYAPLAKGRLFHSSLTLNFLFVMIFSVLFLIICSSENNLFIEGKENGLVESVDMFAFLVFAAAMPFVIKKHEEYLVQSLSPKRTPVFSSSAEECLDRARRRLNASLGGGGFLEKNTYGALTAIGIILFSWNTIQNQDPLRFVGFVGWDTVYYPVSFAVTRIFRLYLWVFLMPALVHSQAVGAWTVRSLFVEAAQKRAFEIDPYHSDECGGVRVFVDAVFRPTGALVVGSGILTLAVIIVHRQLNVTTIGAVILTTLLLIILYIIPTSALRRIIVDQKEKRLREIGFIQREILKSLPGKVGEGARIRDLLSALTMLDEVAARIKAVPEMPQLRAVIKTIGIAWSPSLFGKLALDLLKGSSILNVISSQI